MKNNLQIKQRQIPISRLFQLSYQDKPREEPTEEEESINSIERRINDDPSSVLEHAQYVHGICFAMKIAKIGMTEDDVVDHDDTDTRENIEIRGFVKLIWFGREEFCRVSCEGEVVGNCGLLWL